MEYFIRKYHECNKVTADSARALGQIVAQGDPHQIETARNFLARPGLEFYRLIGPESTAGRYVMAYVRLREGEDFPEHYHDDVYATVFFVEGRGHAIINGTKHAIEAGDVVFLPPGTMHVIVADQGPLTYLACASPDLGQDGKPNITFR